MKTFAIILSPRRSLLALAAVLCSASASQGQILSTGTFTSDAVLTLAGPFANEVYGVATNNGIGTIKTANGYTFLGSAGQTDVTITGYEPEVFTGFSGNTTTGDMGLDNVINTSLYGQAVTYTLNNLTLGNIYTVLIFAADDRGASGDSAFSLTDGSMTSASQQFFFAGGVAGAGVTTEGGYLLDTFTATGTSHVVAINEDQEGQGILVESAVPEPGTYVLLFAGVGALAFSCRRSRRA